MKCYEVVGYAHEDGYAICADCATTQECKECAPIFADSEWDSYPTCDRCLCAIEDVCLIEQEG